MQTSPQAVSAGFALTFALLSLTPVASAGPQEDVAAAASEWALALGEDDPDKVLPFYANDATAVNTGYYTFSYVQNGEAKTLPARYSFTYVQSGDHWLIVDHHSSAMPPAPK